MTLCINPNCKNPDNPDNTLFCRSCGSELLLGGKYRVTRLMSDKGGFGLTYEVIHNNIPKVLKVLTQNAPKVVELFEQEARILTQLNHPGIPKGEKSFLYYPRDSQTPIHCLVMEKIEGMDLEEYQKQRRDRPIDQDIALEWLKKLAEILHVVHSNNFFHRDIKPSNIILKPDGQLTLIDFGAVRQVTATIVAGQQNTGIYTPGYAPTEQEKGFAVPQSDFYALGRTFVYLLTGRHPTDPQMYDQYNNELKWRDFVVDIAPQLADFLDHLMADKAIQRPKDTGEILRNLEEIERSLDPPTIPTTVLPIPRKVPNNITIPETVVSGQLPQKRKVTWKFLPVWILIHIISIMMSFGIFHSVEILYSSNYPSMIILIVLSLFFIGAIGQWLILRRYLNKFRWWLWMLATISGSFVGVYWGIFGAVGLSSLFKAVGLSSSYSYKDNYLIFFIWPILSGILLGISQEWILCMHLQKTKYWVLINTIWGVLVGILIDLVRSFYKIEINPNDYLGWLCVIIAGILYSILTGLTMYWLLKHPKN